MLPVPSLPTPAIDTAAQRADNRPLVAAILRVEGDQAVLAVAGVQVVARLTSPEQAAWLAGQRTALFVPHWLNPETLALQWVGTPSESPLVGEAVQVAPDMLGAVLRQMGEPASEPQQLMAAALLANHLSLTAENLQALAASLAPLPAWGAPEANMAARLLAQGLSPSPDMITAALAPDPPTSQALLQLNDELSAFVAEHADDPAPRQLGQVLVGLDRLMVDWTATPQHLAEQVQAAIVQLGRSLENTLSASSGGPPPGSLPGAMRAEPPLLLRLAMLRSDLGARFGETAEPLTRAIDRFLGAVRREQLANAHTGEAGAASGPGTGRAPATAPAAERWLSLSFPLVQSRTDPNGTGAQLRVAYQPPEQPADRFSLSHTRLVLSVEVEGQPVTVDLAISGAHVGAHVTLPTPELRDRAEAELPGLSAGLARLGFTLQAAQCTTGEAAPHAGTARPITVSTYA